MDIFYLEFTYICVVYLLRQLYCEDLFNLIFIDSPTVLYLKDESSKIIPNGLKSERTTHISSVFKRGFLTENK